MARKSVLAGIAEVMGRTKAAASEIMGDVEAHRSRLRELRAERSTVESAPVDIATIARRVASELDSHEKRARQFWRAEVVALPDYDPLHDRARLNSLFTTDKIGGSSLGGLCVLGFRDTVEKTILSNIGVPVGGMDDATRRKSLDRIDAEIEDAEVNVERLIRAAESAGITIHRAADANPRHYLAKDI